MIKIERVLRSPAMRHGHPPKILHAAPRGLGLLKEQQSWRTISGLYWATCKRWTFVYLRNGASR